MRSCCCLVLLLVLGCAPAAQYQQPVHLAIYVPRGSGWAFNMYTVANPLVRCLAGHGIDLERI